MFLNENGISSINLHGDMLYKIRLGKFKQYQNGEVNVLVCTDIASRGLNTIRVSKKNKSLQLMNNNYYCMNFRLNMLLTMNFHFILLIIFIDVVVLVV